MKDKVIRIPDGLSEAEIIDWMDRAFRKIIEVCRVKKIARSTFIVDYGGSIEINGKSMPCQKEWTLKDMKKWVKDLEK